MSRAREERVNVDDIRRVELERLAARIRDSTAAQGVDAYAVEECGLASAEWAEMTGRDRSTVSRNVRRADGG